MPIDPGETIYFKQARFTTRLPTGYLYAPSHYWLEETEPGAYRVGLTKFATRMLGDFVEHKFAVQSGSAITVGQSIGWIEGFKALSDIYSVVDGEFLEDNPRLAREPALVDKDPYDGGWLYKIKGQPADNVGSVDGYVTVLEATIERMLAEQRRERDDKC